MGYALPFFIGRFGLFRPPLRRFGAAGGFALYLPSDS